MFDSDSICELAACPVPGFSLPIFFNIIRKSVASAAIYHDRKYSGSLYVNRDIFTEMSNVIPQCHANG